MKIDRTYLGILLFIIVAVAINFYNNMKTEELLSLEQRYVVGQVIKIEYPVKGGPSVTVEYKYLGNSYTLWSKIGEYKVEENDKLLISIPKDHEDEGIILFDHPVPSGKEAPANGWDEIPEFVKR